VVSGSISTIDWSAGPYYIKISVDGVEMGTSQLLSVPYALHAKNAGNGFTGNYNDLSNKPALFDGDYTNLTNKPVLFDGKYSSLTETPVAWDSSWASVKNKPSFATVATSGSYNDLSNKPSTTTGTNSGDMQYWNGTAWVVIPVGLPGQYLTLSNTKTPTWSSAFSTITTTTISSISSGTAMSGGNIISDGGAPIIARGVCWSPSTNPTIALTTKTSDATGTGTFTSSITGLTIGSIYYVRAYATNSVGTSYGEELCFTALTIGDYYKGGQVAYILKSGDPGFIPGEAHGIIAASDDQGTGKNWCASCTSVSGIFTGATGTALGTGNLNTLMIVSYLGMDAAQICSDLSLNGYSDWYLPSKDELNKIYVNRSYLNCSTNPYWSSSEINSTEVWAQRFSDGVMVTMWKNMSFSVRAIRAF